MRKGTGQKAYEQLSDFLNASTAEARREFVEQVAREHPEIQTVLAHVMLDMFDVLARQGVLGRVDARNEFAVKTGMVVTSVRQQNGLGL